MRNNLAALVAGSLLTAALAVAGGAAPAAAAPAATTQGVTATTIRIGIPYVDLAAVRKYGVTLDQGNYPDAWNALVANLNAHGGVDGRHVVPYLVAVNPVGTAPAATACTQLAADDKVFVAIAPQQPDCFLQQYGVPTVAGSFENISATSGAPNFSLSAPLAAYDPVQLAVFAHEGVFKNKTVGIFAGALTDQHELAAVQSALGSLHVHVAQSAVDDAPTGDQAATYQQVGVVAQRFKAAGVNEVVAVGTGSLVWPEGLQSQQSTYHPPWIGTSEPSLETAVLASSISPTYLQNVLTSSQTPSNYQVWHEPDVQQCARVVRKAYPSDTMTPPANPIRGSDQTFFAVESACINLALFTTIAEAAGKHLTVSTFTKAGEGLRNVAIPGAAGPVSFGPHRPYPIGPVIPVTFDAAHDVLQFANAPAAG